MKDWDEIDRMFKILNDMMDNNFSGAYSTDKHTPNEVLDIQEDDKHIYISAEIKVRDEDISVIPNEDSISFEIMTDGRWSKKTLNLPCKVKPKSAKISFKNYVLDVELEKAKHDTRNDRRDRQVSPK